MNAISPAFAAPYADSPGAAIVPAIDATLTTSPCERFRSGSAKRVIRNAPRRLTASCRSQCLVARSSILPPTPTPAELTRTSSDAKRSACAALTRAQSSSFETSAATASAPSSPAAAARRSAPLATSVRPYPSSCSAWAIARPMPDEPPVIRAAGMDHPCKLEGSRAPAAKGTRGIREGSSSPLTKRRRDAPPLLLRNASHRRQSVDEQGRQPYISLFSDGGGPGWAPRRPP